jgi:MFS family permease
MTEAQWRELIDSYVAGRLSADSFKRRFLEAFSAQRLVPSAIQDLFFVVDAYGGDPMGRGHDVTDDAQLMVAARRALLGLAPPETASSGPGPRPAGPQTPPPGVAGRPPLGVPPRLAAGIGMGCAVAATWAAVGILQVFAIAEQVDRVAHLGPVLSTVAAFVLTFIPVVGSVIAFFGAMDGWQWAPWLAGLVFLALPLTFQLGSLLAWRSRR